MHRREAMRQTMMFDNLRRLGFTQYETEQLRRISLTLSHWAERECNEDIETRDDGSAWVTDHSPFSTGKTYRIPNREAGALRRLAAILRPHARKLTCYHQQDPRGAALYIISKARMREYAKRYTVPMSDSGRKFDLDCCYSQIGIAVY